MTKKEAGRVRETGVQFTAPLSSARKNRHHTKQSSPGLETIFFEWDLPTAAANISIGLLPETLDDIQKKLGLSNRQLSDLLQISTRTLTRRRTEKRLPPDESERVYRVARLAEIAGGRFNSAGLRAVYTSGSLSLAMLKLLVQVDDKNSLFGHFSLSAFFGKKHVEIIDEKDLPTGWDCLPFGRASQVIGDRWLIEQRSLILQVPSVVVPRESNFVINPVHPSFSELEIGNP